jgi:hypothetical protein
MGMNTRANKIYCLIRSWLYQLMLNIKILLKQGSMFYVGKGTDFSSFTSSFNGTIVPFYLSYYYFRWIYK